MNKLTAYLGGGIYAESMPGSRIVKIYEDEGAAQRIVIYLHDWQIEALKKFLAQIEEGCE